MRILQINSLKNSGSTGRIAEGIGLKVIELGGESYIAYGRTANPGPSIPVKIGNSWDQIQHLICTRLFDTHGFHSKNATQDLIKKIETIAPDIIHLHNLHGYFINVHLLFKFLSNIGIPLVWTIHDCWPFTGHCCYYERIHCTKWKTECYNCELKKLYPRSYLWDNSRKNFREKKRLFNLPNNMQLVTVSYWLENQVKESFLKNYPVTTIYNGVDLSLFKPQNREELRKKFGFEKKKIILGIANVWSEGKGLQSFIELSRMIKSDWQIVLVGLTKKQIICLPKNILGIEKINSISELVIYYNIADVFVTPSIAETFGVVVIEALACGTPVVVFETSSLPELVNKDVGFIVPVNDTSLMYKCICDIFIQNRSVYSEKCRERAENLFDVNMQYKKYISLYNSLF